VGGLDGGYLSAVLASDDTNNNGAEVFASAGLRVRVGGSERRVVAVEFSL